MALALSATVFPAADAAAGDKAPESRWRSGPADITIRDSADLSGAGGADLVFTRLVGGVANPMSRIEALDGTSGEVLWGYGDAPSGPLPADPEPSIEDLRMAQDVVPVGGAAQVSGTFWATDQPPQQVWSDQAFPNDSVAIDPDMDLIEGTVRHARPGDDVRFTIRVREDPVGDGSAKGSLTFLWPFTLGSDFYLLRMYHDARANPLSPAWSGGLHGCDDAACSGELERLSAASVAFDRFQRTATGSVPLHVIAGPNGVRGPQTITHSPDARPASGLGFSDSLLLPSPGVNAPVDTADALGSGTIPVAEVRLGVAPEGTPAEDVEFSEAAELELWPASLDVGFAGEISLDGRPPGTYRVWVQGCFASCAVASVRLTVTG